MKSRKSSKLPRHKKPFILRRIFGHSMMPVLPPGTIVLGIRWFRSIKPGQVVIFHHNNKEKIKRVDQVDGTRMYVLGDHSDTSTDSRHFGWVDTGTVLAKVIWPHAPKDRSEHVEIVQS